MQLRTRPVIVNKKKKVVKKKQDRAYKILVGNSSHLAIGEFKGVFVEQPGESKHKMILLNGVQVTCSFRSRSAGKGAIAAAKGRHIFRGYPKVDARGILQHIELTCVDPTEEIFNLQRIDDRWMFIGLWTPQRNITVQRSMANAKTRAEVRKTKYLPKYKYPFVNSYDFKRSLWMGYVYKVEAKLNDNGQFEICRVTPFACPRNKPLPNNRR